MKNLEFKKFMAEAESRESRGTKCLLALIVLGALVSVYLLVPEEEPLVADAVRQESAQLTIQQIEQIIAEDQSTRESEETQFENLVGLLQQNRCEPNPSIVAGRAIRQQSLLSENQALPQ